MGLRQKDVAQPLGVATDSVAYWENNRNQPSLRMIPRITEFLGYNSPLLESGANETFGGQIVRTRRALGLTQKDLARRFGVDPSTLAHWEYGRQQPMPENRVKLEVFVDRGWFPDRSWSKL